MTLSTRWAASSHRALAASSTDIQRLALALGPVRSIIRVIDDHRPPMAVDWASVGQDDEGRPLSKSFTDFEGGRIALNPMPVLQFGWTDPGKAIDICAGFGMHEASHGKHSRDRYKDLLRKDSDGNLLLKPLRVAAYLWNLVEDVRIEDCTSGIWPGFAAYFDAVLDWVFDDLSSRASGLPTFYGTSVKSKMRVVFLACRYPKVALPGVDTAEIAWWQAWQADYLADRTDVRTTIERGLARLAIDEETETEMAGMAAEEERERAKGEQLMAQLDRLMKEGIHGAFEVCASHSGDMRPLSANEAEAVTKLVKEGFITIVPEDGEPGASCSEIRVTKPQETIGSRAAYIGRPDATVEALRAALVFRAEKPQYDIKLQKSGTLDETELHRFALGDMRLFSERVIEGRPDTLVGLLVDISGSMTSGRKLETAQRLAQLLVWALHDMDGIETRVWAHTADADGEGADVFRIFEQGDPLTRLGLLDTLPHSNNADGWAVNYCVSQMVDEPQPQKVLIVLADGRPSAHDYRGDPAIRHVRSVVDAAARQGITVIQVAIDPDLRPSVQSVMFGDSVVPYTSEAALPRQLTQVLSRWA